MQGKSSCILKGSLKEGKLNQVYKSCLIWGLHSRWIAQIAPHCLNKNRLSTYRSCSIWTSIRQFHKIVTTLLYKNYHRAVCGTQEFPILGIRARLWHFGLQYDVECVGYNFKLYCRPSQPAGRSVTERVSLCRDILYSCDSSDYVGNLCQGSSHIFRVEFQCCMNYRKKF